MSYIGRQLNNLSDRVKLDSITASATATYNLLLNGVAYVPSSAESLTVSLNGVIQSPVDSYTVSSSTITFASTLSASDSIDFILAERSITFQTPSSGSVGITELAVSDGTNGQALTTNGSGTLSFSTVSADADNYFATSGLSSKDLGVGLHIKLSETNASVNTGADALVIEDNGGDTGMSILSSTSSEGRVSFGNNVQNSAGSINYSHSDDSMRFYTGQSERMRIQSDGSVHIGSTTGVYDATEFFSVQPSGTGSGDKGIGIKTFHTNAHGIGIWNTRNDSYNTATLISFAADAGSGVGSITTNGSTTAYNTSSDYRLKENETPIVDGIERLKQLKPYKFNFKADADTTVDGFFAHEVTPIVPEAIIGEKDEIEKNDDGTDKLDDEGNSIPKYQGIDQSKLVPLLTSALQEAITKIETLEAENTDIKARLTALENA